MLTIAEQLSSIQPIKAPRVQALKDNAQDRARGVFDTLSSIGNATPARLAQDLPYNVQGIRRYLRILMKEKKVVSWRLANETWYSVASPSKRRK